MVCQHVVDQLADAVVDRGHGLGHRVQAGVGVTEDGQQAMTTAEDLRAESGNH
jgi:hypothetical protein